MEHDGSIIGWNCLPLPGIIAGSIPAAGSPTRLFHLAAAVRPWMDGCHFPPIYPRFYDDFQSVLLYYYFFFFYFFIFISFDFFDSTARDLSLRLRARYFSYFALLLWLFIIADLCCRLMVGTGSLASIFIIHSSFMQLLIQLPMQTFASVHMWPIQP